MINFKNLSEKQALTYTIIGVIVLCLIPTGLLFAFQYESGQGIFSGLMDNPENLTTKLATVQKEKSRIEAKLNQEKGLLEEKKKLEDEYDRYKKALPEADNLEDIFLLIGNTMHANKVKEKNMRPIKHIPKAPPKPPAAAPAVAGQPAPPPPPVVKTFPVNYVEIIWTFEGNYQDILSFIHAVEDVNFERFVMVSALKLTPIPHPTDETILDYMSGEVTFVSFYYAKDTGVTKK